MKPRPTLTRSWIPCPNDWTSSRWRSLSTVGCSCRRRTHLSFVRTIILQLQNKWWLHSNKKDSTSLPLRNCSDLKQALSILERLQQEAGEEPYVPCYSYQHSWHRIHLLHCGIGKILGVLLQSESQRRSKQSLVNERRDPSLMVLWWNPPKMPFKNSIYVVTDGSFTADVGLL